MNHTDCLNLMTRICLKTLFNFGRINNNLTLERPEALTIETIRVGQTSKRVSVELPEPAEEPQWLY